MYVEGAHFHALFLRATFRRLSDPDTTSNLPSLNATILHITHMVEEAGWRLCQNPALDFNTMDGFPLECVPYLCSYLPVPRCIIGKKQR